MKSLRHRCRRRSAASSPRTWRKSPTCSCSRAGEEHARALNEHGLRVSGEHDFTAQVTAASDPRELPDFDVGIIATKATGLEEAAESLAGRFGDATIMTVQNGLGAEAVVRRRTGTGRSISAVTFMSGTKHSDIHVEYILDTPTWLGPLRRDALRTRAGARAATRRLGTEGGGAAGPEPAQWSKLIFNATVNGVAALTGLPHDAALRRRGWRGRSRPSRPRSRRRGQACCRCGGGRAPR